MKTKLKQFKKLLEVCNDPYGRILGMTDDIRKTLPSNWVARDRQSVFLEGLDTEEPCVHVNAYDYDDTYGKDYNNRHHRTPITEAILDEYIEILKEKAIPNLVDELKKEEQRRQAKLLLDKAARRLEDILDTL